MGWIWGGYAMDPGYGVHVAWIWCGYGVDMEGIRGEYSRKTLMARWPNG